MDTQGLTNVYIERLLKLFDNNFIGVFSADQLYDVTLTNNQSVIINLSTSYEKGSHFIAFKLDENKLIYFDSLCSYILPLEIRDFILSQHHDEFIYNTIPIQDIESSYCGYYCIGFILYMNIGTLDQFLSYFYTSSDKLILNDHLILFLINLYIS
jgi:hypothetical protein